VFRAAHHDQSLVYAEDYIRDKPEMMVNHVVQHIQYLFEIKALSGVLPRLNQIRCTLCCVLCAVHYVLYTGLSVLSSVHWGLSSVLSAATQAPASHAAGRYPAQSRPILRSSRHIISCHALWLAAVVV